MKKWITVLAAAALLLLAGCGGGGSGGGSSSSSSVGMFVTDNISNLFDHVWVTIKRVDLIGAGGTQTVFNDATGAVVDLRSLNVSGTAHFDFLGLKAVPTGVYTSVQFTMDENLKVVPTGTTTAVGRVFAGSTAGVKVLTLSLPGGEHVGGHDNIVADFDLSQWTDDGTFITAVVTKHSGQGLDDPNNHEANEHHGTLSNLAGTAPSQTFDLSQPNGTALHVTVDATTVLFADDGVSNPALANGERVEVRGTFDVTTNSLLADSIKIEEGQHDDHPQVEGKVATIGVNQFTVTIHDCDHFLPGGTTVNVVVSDSTMFFSDGGVTLTLADFFTALTVGAGVEAEGTFDAGTNTLTATKVKLDDGDHHGGGGGGDDHHEGEVRGPVSNIDGVAFTFSVTASHWEGFDLPAGTVISVVTTDSTKFKNHDNQMTRADFFAALTNGTNLEVDGTLSGTTLTATKVKFDN